MKFVVSLKCDLEENSEMDNCRRNSFLEFKRALNDLILILSVPFNDRESFVEGSGGRHTPQCTLHRTQPLGREFLKPSRSSFPP